MGHYAATLTHCRRGHEYANGNSYFDPKGKRWCRICKRMVLQKSKKKARENGTYRWDDPKRSSKWHFKNRERSRLNQKRWTLRVKYGLALEAYNLMLKSQKYKCAICRNRLSDSTAAVDHNHENGKVRGLLCTLCNAWLGRISDSKEAAMRAFTYIERDGV